MKIDIRRALLRFIQDESGPTAVEYAVILALIVGVCLGSVTLLANGTRGSFDSSANAIAGAL
ncbi:MAG: Flp family type IVb pilin [Planctomycetota bacterium]